MAESATEADSAAGGAWAQATESLVRKKKAILLAQHHLDAKPGVASSSRGVGLFGSAVSLVSRTLGARAAANVSVEQLQSEVSRASLACMSSVFQLRQMLFWMFGTCIELQHNVKVWLIDSTAFSCSPGHSCAAAVLMGAKQQLDSLLV